MGPLDNDVPSRITVDITSFSKIELLLVLRLLDRLRLLHHTRLLYTEPKEYAVVATSVWQSPGISEVSIIPTFKGLYDSQRDLALVLFLGYEGDRALATWENVEPNATYVVIPRPAYQPEWEGRTERHNAALLAALDFEESVRYADSREPASTFNLLERLIGERDNVELNWYVSHLGTKLQLIGLYYFLARHPDTVSVIDSKPYGDAVEYESLGVGQTWLDSRPTTYRHYPLTPQVINVREEMAEFVPSRRYATHAIDRYPAKMIPHLARFGIERCSSPNQIVFDPFCGCGTVLVESRLSGRASVGVDVNPYAVILTRAKTHSMTKMCSRRLSATSWLRPEPFGGVPLAPCGWSTGFTPSLSVNCSGSVLSLTRSKMTTQRATETRYELSWPSPSAWFPKQTHVAQSLSSPNGLAEIGAVVLLMPSPRSSNEASGFAGATADYASRLDGIVVQDASPKLGDAAKLPLLADSERYDAVVSSPPYLSAQDYYRSSKLELAVLGLSDGNDPQILGSQFLGSGRGTVRPLEEEELGAFAPEVKSLHSKDPRAAAVVVSYLRGMHTVISKCTASTKLGGRVCLIVGDSTIRSIPLPVHTWVQSIAMEAGLAITDHYLDAVRDRQLAPQRKGHRSVIEHEHILLFSKRCS